MGRLNHQFNLRTDDVLSAAIKESAKQHHRSMNSEIVAQLRAAYEASPPGIAAPQTLPISRSVAEDAVELLRSIAIKIGAIVERRSGEADDA